MGGLGEKAGGAASSPPVSGRLGGGEMSVCVGGGSPLGLELDWNGRADPIPRGLRA